MWAEDTGKKEWPLGQITDYVKGIYVGRIAYEVEQILLTSYLTCLTYAFVFSLCTPPPRLNGSGGNVT
jgi:hypothetical protein